MFTTKDLAAIKLGLASPDTIRGWSKGEVTKPETINYRSHKPEPDGLYCEKIFGPSKDYECHCGKLKKVKHQGQTCDKCGVEVISRQVRRERMGHIELASPCTHFWYTKGNSSKLSIILGAKSKDLEKVILYNAYICLDAGRTDILTKGEVLTDNIARSKFVEIIKTFINDLNPESVEFVKANNFLALESEDEEFDFLSTAAFIHNHIGSRFGQGAEAIKQLLNDINVNEEFEKAKKDLVDNTSKNTRNRLLERYNIFKAFKETKMKPSYMVLDVIPVIPPDLRPMLQLDGGRFASSDINEIYRRVISRNNRLKKLINEKSPHVILNNEKRMLQDIVNALIDNDAIAKPIVSSTNSSRPLKSFSDNLSGKQGRFRQNLLGKRVDYSGRSVIAVGPDLKMYQCGLPREMAIQLLRPFIASILMKEKHVTTHKEADMLIDSYAPKAYDILERIISDHPVLLNRAPTLHRLSIQAFQPILVDGRAIRLHPLVCTGFNADFDGDQMAVHVPLSKAAQEEALNLMLANNNIIGPKDGQPIVTPSQDMVLGNYYLTLETTKAEFEARSKRRENSGELLEAEKFALYASLEGKVFGSVGEVISAYETHSVHLHSRVAIIGKALRKTDFSEEMNNSYLVTTVGKIIFNLIFPADFPYLNGNVGKELFVKNLTSTPKEFFVPRGTNIKEYIGQQEIIQPFKKGHLSDIINEVFKRYGTTKTSVVLDKIKDQGFKFATAAGVTIAISDIQLVAGKDDYIAKGDEKVKRIEQNYEDGLATEKEKHDEVIKVWTEIKDTISKKLENQLQNDKRNPLFIMVDSGARGNYGNFTQLEGMRGLMADHRGETIEIPIKSSFREGMTVSEFFNSTHGARKGGADTAIKTSDSGFLTRKLVGSAQDIIVRSDDCGSDAAFLITDIYDGHGSNEKVIIHLKDRIHGRYLARDLLSPKTGELIASANTLVDENIVAKVVAADIKEVYIRNLFGCLEEYGVCRKCYGLNLATGKVVDLGEAVGVMAAQSIGEPGTQLTMRTFHSGGVAGSDITQGLPRVTDLVERRISNSFTRAVISEIPGKVTSIEATDKKIIVDVTNELETKHYSLDSNATLRVAVGDEVLGGSKLSEGAVDLSELLAYSDMTTVQNYMLKEIQKPYRNQKIDISEKHIEVIVRQMMRKVVITEKGETDLEVGTRVSSHQFLHANKAALIEGKMPAAAHPVILPITTATLDTDSFLTAASFRETSNVLTNATIKGHTDYLRGLNENVITGKLIPAGRGALNEEQQAQLLEGFSVREKMKQIKEEYIGVFDKVSNE